MIYDHAQAHALEPYFVAQVLARAAVALVVGNLPPSQHERLIGALIGDIETAVKQGQQLVAALDAGAIGTA